jgi:hypothetical protein
MDSISIQTELLKLNKLHDSFTEHNPMTYVIFFETFRQRLSSAQIEMIEAKITELDNKHNQQMEELKTKIDYDLFCAPLSEKMSDTGYMVDEVQSER